MSDPLLRLSGVRRRFRQGMSELEILQGVDLELGAGTIAALVGPSGSGKSTLLHIAGLLERPSAGEVTIEGRSCGPLGDRERTRLRREQIGFVYQFHNLLPDFTALENVMMPQLVAGRGRGEARRRAGELLGRMGLAERVGHRPGRLSGGEQQRVAIARALANEPRLILADEPTGNLDPHTADTVFAELLGVARASGTAMLIATHNPELAARMDATWRLSDGRLERA
ncbi:ABC transporter ATP-binding protein [Marinimicrococcus flavescens]|uniref:ABC transporter ATP-binding protein n=1 Tax=Marinimicrococcus flavescens TaxID=3031815 RepID=A0AAP3XS94_9PROT|nr:ABC transporter ATP-binding protein [Marinimicrococcus flavescens]